MEESKIISGLKFERYEVDEVSFNRNQKLPEGIDTWEIDFDVGAMVKTNEEKNKMKESCLKIDAPEHEEHKRAEEIRRAGKKIKEEKRKY